VWIRIAKNRKGGVLLEFAFSALLFFTVLISSVEWSLEVYVRHATERGLAAATRVYAATGDEAQARDVAIQESIYIISRCLDPIDFRLYNSITGFDMADPTTGYAPTGTPADDAAVFARLELTCVWRRLTPITASILGPDMKFSTIGLVRMR
jgi:hypothetical protein